MHLWKEFLDTLDTPGGHILMAFVLFIIGLIATKYGFEGKEVSSLSLGALLLALKGQRPNGH